MESKLTFKISISSAGVFFHNNIKDDRDSHYPILHRLLNFMCGRGFKIGRDPEIIKKYKCLNKDHWYGRKDNLEFKAERYPTGFKLQFFQNINFENRHGGCYDFDKYDKMPYLIKLLFRNECRHIKNFLEILGCIDNSETSYKLAVDKVKKHLVESWHKPYGSMESFNLEDTHGQTNDYSFNNTDRDGKTIFNGQIKYFRHRNGRLMRGTVYHNINNMWWVLVNKFYYTNIADFQLFDLSEADLSIRRKVKNRKPEEFLLKKEKIKESSSKELINELKRRGVKLKVC